MEIKRKKYLNKNVPVEEKAWKEIKKMAKESGVKLFKVFNDVIEAGLKEKNATN